MVEIASRPSTRAARGHQHQHQHHRDRRDDGRTSGLVALLDVDPDLGDGLSPEATAEARTRLVVRATSVRAGGRLPGGVAGLEQVEGAFALLVFDGLLARRCVLAGRPAAQLVGPGELLPLAPSLATLPSHATEVEVVADARVAVLGTEVLRAAEGAPLVVARLLERALSWADRSALQQAISQLGQVDQRVVALLWHLAERWGRMGQDHVVVPLRLTHETIGQLVGAQRPTVSVALRTLSDAGVVSRTDGGWLLDRASGERLAPRGGVRT